MLTNLAVTKAAASRSMTTQAAVKAELDITGNDDDAKIDRLIVSASAALAASPEALNIDPRGGAGPWFQSYTESLPGDGGQFLYPSRWPLVGKPVVTYGTGASPTTVDASLYSVDGRRRALYKATGWLKSPWPSDPWDQRELSYNIAAPYDAGWLMPSELVVWAAATAVSLGTWRTKTSPADDEPLVFVVTTAGTTHASTEPTWPTAIGGTVTDNDVVWTAYDQELPKAIQEAALITVLEWFAGGLNVPAGLVSERQDAWAAQYRQPAGGLLPAIPPHAAALCRRFSE